jgi:hypothetical protein
MTHAAVMVANRSQIARDGGRGPQPPPLAALQRLRSLKALGLSQRAAAADLGWPLSRVRGWWSA